MTKEKIIFRKNKSLIFLTSYLLAFAVKPAQASTSIPDWTESLYSHCRHIWVTGKQDIYLTGYAWHNRYTYRREKIASYNESAWGGGIGRSLYDEHGNWQSLYSLALLDSHKNIQPVAGYAFIKMKHWDENIGIGIGYSLLITARPDIFYNIPFPGALPMLSLNYRKASLLFTYIPGNQGNGNVLFVFGKWGLG